MSASQPTEPSSAPAAGDDATVTTGMATGSEAGAPGDHAAAEPLDEAEQDLLDRLRGDDSPPVVDAAEDGPAAAEAAEDDSVLPLGDSPATPDQDTPQFLAPE